MKLNKHGRLAVSEAQIQRACVDVLRMAGWIVRPAPREGQKAARGAHSVPAGEPDLIAVKPRRTWLSGATGYRTDWRVLLVECKAADGRLSEAQCMWRGEWCAPVHTVRSVDDLRAVLAVLAAEGRP